MILSIFFLQIDSIDPGRLWEINPYNGAAYGALLVFLFAAILHFRKESKDKEDYNRALVDRIHSITEETNIKLVEIRQSGEIQNTKVIGILENLQDKLRKIDDKR